MHHARVFTDSHHTMRCPCVIKTVIDELHPMILFKTKFMFYKPKLFGFHFSNDHFIYKLLVSFVGSGFLESHRRLRTLSTLFGLSPSECSKLVEVFLLEEVSNPSYYYSTQVFRFIQPCDFVELRPTVPSPPTKSLIVVLDSNHAPTPMKCDVPVYDAMQCAIAC